MNKLSDKQYFFIFNPGHPAPWSCPYTIIGTLARYCDLEPIWPDHDIPLFQAPLGAFPLVPIPPLSNAIALLHLPILYFVSEYLYSMISLGYRSFESPGVFFVSILTASPSDSQHISTLISVSFQYFYFIFHILILIYPHFRNTQIISCPAMGNSSPSDIPYRLPLTLVSFWHLYFIFRNWIFVYGFTRLSHFQNPRSICCPAIWSASPSHG